MREIISRIKAQSLRRFQDSTIREAIVLRTIAVALIQAMGVPAAEWRYNAARSTRRR
jgi:hypothetical protein